MKKTLLSILSFSICILFQCKKECTPVISKTDSVNIEKFTDASFKHFGINLTASDMINDRKGNYIIAGTIDSTFKDKVVCKISPDFKLSWLTKLDPDNGFSSMRVANTMDNNFIVLNSLENPKLTKLSGDGKILFNKFLGAEAGRDGIGLVQIPNSDYLLISNSVISLSSNVTKFYITRTSSNGDIKWAKKFSIDSVSRVGKICLSTFNNGVALLFTPSNTDFDLNMILQFYDYDGNLKWQRKFPVNAISSSYGNCLITTKDNGFLLAYSHNYFHGECNLSDIQIIKLNQSGNTIWQYTYGGPRVESSENLVETNDGNYIMIGDILDKNLNIQVIKIDQSGSVIWAKNYGGKAEELGHNVIEKPNGNLIIMGNTKESDKVNDWGFFLFETDQNGRPL